MPWPRTMTRRLMAAVLLMAGLCALGRWLWNREYVERPGVFFTWELTRTRTNALGTGAGISKLDQIRPLRLRKMLLPSLSSPPQDDKTMDWHEISG